MALNVNLQRFSIEQHRQGEFKRNYITLLNSTQWTSIILFYWKKITYKFATTSITWHKLWPNWIHLICSVVHRLLIGVAISISNSNSNNNKMWFLHMKTQPFDLPFTFQALPLDVHKQNQNRPPTIDANVVQLNIHLQNEFDSMFITTSKSWEMKLSRAALNFCPILFYGYRPNARRSLCKASKLNIWANL